MMKDWLTNFSFKFVITIFLIFAAYSNVNLLIRNYRLEKMIDESRTNAQKADDRNKQLSLLISYYKTESYQDIEARRRLAVKMPDETSLLVKGLDYSKLNNSGEIDLTNPYENKIETTSNKVNFPLEWWYFLTGQKT